MATLSLQRRWSKRRKNESGEAGRRGLKIEGEEDFVSEMILSSSRITVLASWLKRVSPLSLCAQAWFQAAAGSL